MGNKASQLERLEHALNNRPAGGGAQLQLFLLYSNVKPAHSDFIINMQASRRRSWSGWSMR